MPEAGDREDAYRAAPEIGYECGNEPTSAAEAVWLRVGYGDFGHNGVDGHGPYSAGSAPRAKIGCEVVEGT